MTVNVSATTVPADSLKPLSAAQRFSLLYIPGHWLNKPPCRVGYLICQQTLESGGEDLPEAYRWVPAHPKEGALNVVAAWSVNNICWMFKEMYGQVFGRAAAVINFHRIQRLLVAVIRRWLLVLCSCTTMT